MSDLYAGLPPTGPTGPSQESNAAADSSSSPGQIGRIEEIVVRDNARRKRAFYILSVLLCITVALAFLVLAFGRNEQKALERNAQSIVEDTINKQAPNLVNSAVNNAVNERIPSIVDTQLTPIITQSVNDSVDALLSKRIDNYVAPRFESLKNQLFPYAAEPTVNVSTPYFSKIEAQDVKKAVATQLPQQLKSIRMLAVQVDELKALSNTAGDNSWSKDKDFVVDQIASLETGLKNNETSMKVLLSKLESISVRIAKLEGTNGPCAETPAVLTNNFRTYTVKENSETELYDLNLRVLLRGQKKTQIRGVTIYRGDKIVYPPTDLTMGTMITFSDDKHRYALIPVFIVNRFLANEYIGFAISRTVKCPPKPD